MALSDYERNMLEQLEAQLKGEDPQLATSLASDDVEQTRLALSVRHVVLGLIAAVAGLGVVATGVATEMIIIGVVGAVIVWFGLMYILGGMSRVSAEPGRRPAKAAPPTVESFMERQKRAFEQRREEGGR
ncbi:DUF3040 domain-containing protein [Arcanobacterium phocisimile]|uniref:DUF3040 domain-containing protein n=1 Tax=Arcanobacterium phocisimile TaxID=1302235 RepID=A0ABX7II44_9ACTO|nr:DUF3040 domain-containing protein [Arcanobacterium phocisimile]QRV02767.1 DUF3040 domain-containing protein [Arcanobacterium phocisimile]